MTDSELLEAFMSAMAGEWIVERYSVDSNEKLRVHYISKMDNRIEWSHNPGNSLDTTPKVGDVGMLGFIGKKQVDLILGLESDS